MGRPLRRGEVWWADVDERRPVGLVSRDDASAIRALVIVAPASTTVRGFTVEVKVGPREGLDRTCVVNCDWPVTLPKRDLVERAGVLSPARLAQLDEAVRFALGLD